MIRTCLSSKLGITMANNLSILNLSNIAMVKVLNMSCMVLILLNRMGWLRERTELFKRWLMLSLMPKLY